MKKATDIIFTVAMSLVIILAVLIAGVRIFGLMPYAVISGSMEPEYPVGSLIYVKKVPVSELVEDVPITYVIEGGTVVTHRIVEVLPDEDNPTVVRFRVKGDANDYVDGNPVHINNVIGKPVMKIPLLGYVFYFVQHPPGCYIMIAAIALLMLAAFLPDLISRIISEGEKKEKGDGSADVRALTERLDRLREELKEAERQEESALGSGPGKDAAGQTPNGAEPLPDNTG